MSERYGIAIAHTLIELPYQYYLPDGDYLQRAPKVTYDIKPLKMMSIPLAQIPTPDYTDGCILFDRGSFGLWFTSFTKSFENYLSTPEANEPGLVITRDAQGRYFVQIRPIAGNGDEVHLYQATAPEGHQIEIAIHGHADSLDPQISFAYPSTDDFLNCLKSQYGTEVVIDSAGTTIIRRTAAFFKYLADFLLEENIPTSKVQNGTVSSYFWNKLKAHGINNLTENSLHTRRNIAVSLARLLGLELLRINFKNYNNPRKIEYMNRPENLSESDIILAEDFKQRILSQIV